MKAIRTLKEYQDTINEVRKTKQPIEVVITLSDEELEKVGTELNMEGVDVIVFPDHDEIKPISAF